MLNVYIEPLPKGQWGPIDGYSLEFEDGSRMTIETFRSERIAISEIKLYGYVALAAKVRIPDKNNEHHWELAGT
jgi:hypothetical protein